MKTKTYASIALSWLLLLNSTYAFSEPQTTEEIYALAQKRLPILLETNIDTTNEQGNTALHLAIENNQLNTVKYLLEQGANVNVGLIPKTKTKSQSTGALDLFLEQRIQFTHYFSTPSTLQVYGDRIYEMTPFECDLKEKIENIRIPLLLPISHLVCALIKERALKDKNFTSQPQYATELPLSQAILQGNPEIISLLLNHNADVNGKSITRLTPFMAALLSNFEREETLELLTTLLENGADVNLTDDHWWILDKADVFHFNTYLDVALYYGWQEIAMFLREKGAQTNLITESKDWDEYLKMVELPEFKPLSSQEIDTKFKAQKRLKALPHRKRIARKCNSQRTPMFKTPPHIRLELKGQGVKRY